MRLRAVRAGLSEGGVSKSSRPDGADPSRPDMGGGGGGAVSRRGGGGGGGAGARRGGGGGGGGGGGAGGRGGRGAVSPGRGAGGALSGGRGAEGEGGARRLQAERGGGSRLAFADRLLERETLARDLRLGERRIHVAQLIDKRAPRALVEHPPRLSRVLFEAGDGF